MNKKSRYNFSVIRHKKNLQRSLNAFSQSHDIVTMYQMESDAWVFHFFDYVEKKDTPKKVEKSLEEVEKFEIEVFNRFEFEINMSNPNVLIQSIKNMFEYPKYQSKLIEIIESYNEEIIIEEHSIIKNNFFIQKKEDILIEFGDKLKTLLKTDLSNRFIKQLYTSLYNRVKFPNMYQDNYKKSLESKYSKMRKSKKTTKYTNHFETTIKAYYNYYLQYSWLLEKLKTFEYYLDTSIDGLEFSENDEHVNSWRENYRFLKSNGILDLLFQSMDFLATYIEMFSDDEMQPVSLTTKDGRIYENSIEEYIKENDLEVLYSIKDMTQIYRALYKNIDKDTQYAIEMGYLTYLSESEIFSIDDANIEIRSHLKDVKQNEF